MNTEALVEQVSAIWRRLPRSCVLTQYRYLNIDPGEEQQLYTHDVCESAQLDIQSVGQLEQLSTQCDVSLDEVFRALFHLTLQELFDEEESVLGVCLSTEGVARVSASQVYAEEESPVTEVIAELASSGSKSCDVPMQLWTDSWPAMNTMPLLFYRSMDSIVSDTQVKSRPWPCELSVQRLPDSASVKLFCTNAVADAFNPSAVVNRFLEMAKTITTDTSVADLSNGVSCEHSESDETVVNQVMAIWVMVLKCSTSDLMPDSNYFDLGGTSLNAFKLINLMNRELDLDLTIKDVYENPTVQQMASLT